jgi:glycosyltransferase involved in cell wall biosynthesis
LNGQGWTVQVIHLGQAAGLGGLQNSICRLAEAQARRGHGVYLMQPPWVSPKGPVFSSVPTIPWDTQVARRFDIVHSHGAAGFQNRQILKGKPRPRLVHTYYGTVIGIQIDLRWFQNLVGWNGLAVPRYIVREIVSGQTAAAVIAVSAKAQAEVRRYYGIRNAKISVIPAGYSPEAESASKEYLRQALGLPEDGFLFLFVGRADPMKNISAALEAFRLIKSRFPNCFLVVAPKQEIDNCERVLGVELAPQKMNMLYRSVDALIHPALSDPYPLAVHEALANGLPAIVSRYAGNADYCRHGVDALVLPRLRGPKLVQRLSQMMASLIESRELRTRLGKEAKRKFGPMDWDWVEAETAKVYARL